MKRSRSAALAVFLFIALGISLNSPFVLASAESKTEDLTPLYRQWRLQTFLRGYGSPLLNSSAKFIEVSEKYNLDWRFLVAISGIESTFGKYIPYNSNNPFGFDNGKAKFESFDESVEVVGNYLYRMKLRGLEDPERLAPIYTPPNYRNWTAAVNYFMQELEKTAF